MTHPEKLSPAKVADIKSIAGGHVNRWLEPRPEPTWIELSGVRYGRWNGEYIREDILSRLAQR